MEVFGLSRVCHGNHPFEEVNDTKDFEASKFDGTIVLFENPKRLKRTLNDVYIHIGNRPCVIARELTKIHEEFIRGSIKDIMQDVEKIILKGEMVILIGKDDGNVYF